eukprot:GHUV01023190.1.p1 GENE.GHUV01023190.1~~GHUV01023190.1.p1  ORF type:complete len:362 (+),score=99.07 GHUV01023190.1:694-1779(+)
MFSWAANVPLGPSVSNLTGDQQGSLQFILSGGLGLDSDTTWGCVQEMLAFVRARDPAVASAAPDVQKLISSCQHELSETGPTSGTLTLQSAYKVATCLGTLASQLETMYNLQQQQMSPVVAYIQLLVSSLVKDLKHLLQELQTIRRRESHLERAPASQSLAPDKPLPQHSQQDNAASTVQPIPIHGPQAALEEVTPTPALPWAVLSKTDVAPAAGTSPFNPPPTVSRQEQQQQLLQAEQHPLQPNPQSLQAPQQQQPQQQSLLAPQLQQPFCDFSNYYQMWDIAGLREAAASLVPECQCSLDAPAGDPAMDKPERLAAAADGGLGFVPEVSVPVMPLNVVGAEELVETDLIGILGTTCTNG